MNVAFFINKRMSLKFYKDIISVLLTRKHNIFLIFDYSENRREGKWREFPILDTFQNENSKIFKRIIFDQNNIFQILKTEKIDYMISLNLPVTVTFDKEKFSCKWVLLQNGIDMFHYSKDFSKMDYIFFYSEYWKNKYDHSIDFNQTLKCYGNYQFNNEVIFNRNEILQKYNLKDKKIFLFLPWGPVNLYNFSSKFTKLFAEYFFNWPDPDGKFYNFKKFFYKIICKFYNTELNILHKIYEHCKKNDIQLIIKSRSKRLIDENYIKYCDLILYDEEILKPTIYELLHISNTVFSPLSTISGESVYFKNKTIILDHIFFKYDNEKYFDFFSNEYFKWHNVIKIIGTDEFKSKELNDILNFQFSDLEREKYLSKFFNYDKNVNVPKKIIEQLEKDCK